MRRAGCRRSPPATRRQRGALGVAGDRRDEGDQIGQLAVVETGELQTTMLAAFEIRQRRTKWLRRVLARCAAAGKDENRRVGQRVRDVTQHQQRGRLCPLEVVEHQRERPRLPRCDGGDRSRPRTRGIVPWRRRRPSGPAPSPRVASRGQMRTSSPPHRATCSTRSSTGACSTQSASTLRRGWSGIPVSSQRP